MFLSLPVVLALLGAAPGARLAIVDVDAADQLTALGALVTRALVTEAAAQRQAVLAPEALRATLDEKRYGELKKCGERVACVAQALEGTGATRAVVGRLGRDEKFYHLQLWLVDLAGLALVADVDRAVLIAARRFPRDVEQAVPPLLRGEQEARGTLRIDCGVADAQIFINGEAAGAPPVTRALKPGRHEVRVERARYFPVTRLVTVEAHQETREVMPLLLKPGERPEDRPPPVLVQRPASGAGEGRSLSAVSWLAGAVTVAAGGVGLGFGLLARAQEQALSDGYDPRTLVYQGTRAEALAQGRTALVANVAFGVAGAAAVATVISVVLDATRAPAVQVAPTAAPGAAGLSLGGTF